MIREAWQSIPETKAEKGSERDFFGSCPPLRDRQLHPLGAWITKLEQRMHCNKVIVALANKIARVAWKRSSSSPKRSIVGLKSDKSFP